MKDKGGDGVQALLDRIKTMIKIGDVINYGFYTELTVAWEDDMHFILKDKNGNQKKVYKELVHKHGQKVERK